MGMKGGTTNYPMGPGSNPIGMMGMDLSMHNMPVIGSFFQNPNELHQREQMSKAAEAYTAYRPEMAQAHMNALANQMSVMQPVQNALNKMYGSGGNMNTGQALTNPMGPSMMQQGAAKPSMNPNQFPGGGKGGKFPGLGGKGGK
jgi:hypothetical protein